MKTIYLTELELAHLANGSRAYVTSHAPNVKSTAYMRVEDAAQMVRETAAAPIKEALAIALMTDEQAGQSLQRWKERR